MENFGITINMEQEQSKAKPGRPVDPNSVRQARLAAQEARKQANGGETRLGRPVVEGSARQQRLAEREAKIANGYVPKRGRPKMVKEEQTAAERISDLIDNI
jgi:hypothetical protein